VDYTLRNIDDQDWKRMKVKAALDGKKLIQVLRDLIRAYGSDVKLPEDEK
jgi:plasmid stability protein